MTPEADQEQGTYWSLLRRDGGFLPVAPGGEIAFDEPVSEDFGAFIVNGQNGWLLARADLKEVREKREATRALAIDLAAALWDWERNRLTLAPLFARAKAQGILRENTDATR